MTEIKLTPEELEAIKDDVTFKVKTTETLKHVCAKIDKLNGVGGKIQSLQVHRAIQWGFITAIALGILTMPLWLVRAIMAVK